MTDEHLLRAELQGKHERFSLALEGGNDGLWDWLDTHSQAMWWSPQFYRLLGHEPDAIQASIAEFDAMQHPEIGPAPRLRWRPHCRMTRRMTSSSGCARAR